MAAPFGVSVGDFIAVGNLVTQVVTALKTSRGAASDYQSLVHSLVSLSSSIRTCSNHFLDRSFDPSDPACRNDDASVLNALLYEVQCCKELLEGFMSAQLKYAQSLLPCRPRRLFLDEWRKVKWFVYKTDDVNRLHRDLTSHINAIQIYTLSLIGQSTARLEKALDRNEASTQVLHGRIAEMVCHVRFMAENIPRYVAPWDAGYLPTERPLRFEDFLGRNFPIPLQFCSNLETFHETLKIMFKELPGQEQVSRRQYDLQDISEHSIMEESVWHQKALPGSTIKASVILPLTSARKTETRSCPRCGKVNSLVDKTQRMVRCFFCDLVYEVLQRERIVEIVEPSKPRVRSDSADMTWKAGQVKRPANPRRTSSGEKSLRKAHRPADPFKRIKYINEKVTLRPKLSRDASIKLRNPFTGGDADEDTVVANAEMGDFESAQSWLSSGGSPDIVDDEGKPLLHAAARSGNEHLVRLLLQHGADVNICGGYWHTALQAAAAMAQSSSASIVKMLLEHNANPHVLGGHYGSALQGAAAFCGQHGNDEVVQLLLEYDADVNVPGGTYGSPLIALAFKGEAEMIELLIQHDVDVNLHSGPWGNALQAASATAYVGGEEAARALRENGADVNARGGHFESALHAAASTGKEGIVELLIEAGAEIDAQSEGGETALHQAAEEGKASVVRMLLSHGANTTLLDKRGQTPTEVAVKTGRQSIIRLLQPYA